MTAKISKVYHRENVREAAERRIRWVMNEFEHVVVSFSGGKDSTVLFNLALEAARELGRVPLRVLFIDQEAEWQATIDLVRQVMHHPDVEPMWMQVPMVLFNATSSTEHWLRCWHPDDADVWMRPKEPIAYTENRYGTERFAKLFPAIMRVEFDGVPACTLSGVRADESPGRFAGITSSLSYKDVTWGNAIGKAENKYTFYPLYDWSTPDIWKAIHDGGWSYNRIYDYQYQHGVPLQKMRVSNVHHETSVGSLFYMQEVEPETWSKLTARIAGVDTAGKLGTDDYFIRKLPHMFTSWGEYRDFLLEKLIEDPDWRAGMARRFVAQEKKIRATEAPEKVITMMLKAHVQSILTNDWEGVKVDGIERNPEFSYYIRRKQAASGQNVGALE